MPTPRIIAYRCDAVKARGVGMPPRRSTTNRRKKPPPSWGRSASNASRVGGRPLNRTLLPAQVSFGRRRVHLLAAISVLYSAAGACAGTWIELTFEFLV